MKMTFEKLAYEVKGVQVTEEMAVTVDQLKKVHAKLKELLNLINSTFETGYHVGEQYKFLWACKSDLIETQRKINQKALNLYHAGKEKAEAVYQEV
jgi:hypothetical protein